MKKTKNILISIILLMFDFNRNFAYSCGNNSQCKQNYKIQKTNAC